MTTGKERKRKTKALNCPFCGSPYRKMVPADVVQLNCRYCGGIFLVSSRIETRVFRCPSHPEKIAVGVCGDCAKSFCRECLSTWVLETLEGYANLHLCPECFRRRRQRLKFFLYGQ